MNNELTLSGKIRLVHNDFTKMPRGQLSLQIECATLFKLNSDAACKDLVFLFSKDSGPGGEEMQQKITEKELKDDDASNDVIKFETFHYDDFVKLEVFQKGIMQKNAKLGKAFINVRDLDCVNEEANSNQVGGGDLLKCVPIHLIPSNYGSEVAKRVNGMVFLRASYEPRPRKVFYEPWKEAIYNISSATEDVIDRFEHLNDFLENEFTSTCQHGTLMIELSSVKIPKYMKTGEDGPGQGDIENLVFMLKIRVAKETRIILVGAPDQIHGRPNQRESIQIHSTV